MKNLYWYIIVFLTVGFFTYSYISDNIEKTKMLKDIKEELKEVVHHEDSIKNVANEVISSINKNKEEKKNLEDSLTNLKLEVKRNNQTKVVKNEYVVKDTVYTIDTISYRKEDIELLIIKN